MQFSSKKFGAKPSVVDNAAFANGACKVFELTGS